MSVGNALLTFNYTSGLSYVYGENHDVTEKDTLNYISNGSGKTVILVDAPLFALYGRTQRKIKKGEIVNIQNRSDCVVKLCIEKDGDEYIIERGIKPDRIMIIKNGIPENEEAKKKNANKSIEDDILDGISFEVFKNIIVLNGTSSKHFFEYGKSEKRVFINEIFKLGFLEYLQDQFTTEIRDKKVEVDKSDVLRDFKEKEIERLRSLVDAHENDEVLDVSGDMEKKIESELVLLEDTKNAMSKIVSEDFGGDYMDIMQKHSTALIKINEMNNNITRIDTMIKNMRSQYTSVKKEYKTISENNTCVHCLQNIPDELKTDMFEKLSNQALDMKNKADQMKVKKQDLEKRLDVMQKWYDQIKVLLEQYASLKQKEQISSLLVSQFKGQLQCKVDPKTSLNRVYEEISVAVSELENIITENESHRKNYSLLKVSRDLVGGKNFYGYYIGVFRNYLNKSINEYLEKMVSPHRIKFNNDLEADVYDGITSMSSYETLSTGEKSKINISLLLSFYDVLHSFHRMQTNILVLDEVLDTGLDSSAVAHLHKILKEKIKERPSLGIYVVSHKESENSFADKEGVNKIVFEKNHGFTSIK